MGRPGGVVAAALNGIAVVRAYFLLFTGARHVSTVSLAATTRERFAVLTLAALILGRAGPAACLDIAAPGRGGDL